MTTTKAERRVGRPRKATTLWGDFWPDLKRLHREINPDDSVRWPSGKWRQDPVGFCREVLGYEPWERQIEVLKAIRDNDRVAVRAGRKVSKSDTDAIVALWWYCSWDDACVVMTSTTCRQVEEILWLQVRKMHDRSQRKLAPDDPVFERLAAARTRPIDGEPMLLARSGLTGGFRRVSGFTAREGVGAAGTSGAHQLVIVDEASGIGQSIFDALIGNLAGGGKLLLTGNPTNSEGEFFEAFTTKARSEINPTGYVNITISSEESPNVTAGRVVVPGLATPEWIEERKREWGEDSPLFSVHVRGIPAICEDGKIINLHTIAGAVDRWADTPEDGELYIGIDCAGPGGAGDESVMIPRRGRKMLRVYAWRGLSEEAHLTQLLGIITEHRRNRETVIVNVDCEGPIGSAIHRSIAAHAAGLDQSNPWLRVYGIKASNDPVRDPHYGRLRDEIWASLSTWLLQGGAIVDDTRLTAELHEPSWYQDTRNRLKVTDKRDIRKALGRSPDRADALALAVWEHTTIAHAPHAPTRDATPLDEPAAIGLDPYEALKVWR